MNDLTQEQVASEHPEAYDAFVDQFEGPLDRYTFWVDDGILMVAGANAPYGWYGGEWLEDDELDDAIANGEPVPEVEAMMAPIVDRLKGK